MDKMPSLAEAFRYWFRLGCTSFGGPAGQIAMMHAELVERRRWISERRFLHALNYCMVLPGPEATQLATYIGWLMHGTLGGIIAGGLFVLPSVVVLATLSWIYMAYGSVPAVAAVLYGVKPAVVAIVLAAAWRIGSRTLRNRALAALAVLAFIALLAGLPFPALILIAGAIGWIGGRFAPESFRLGGHAGAEHSYGPALIDDLTPTPAHASFTWAKLRRVAAIGIGLIAASWALLAAASPLLAAMAWFFTKAAFLTFGGAYAVLPYLYSGAVEQFHWLEPGQMIDGLALGETTPGPLIMVVAFIGFVGAWKGGVLAAVAGACVATWFTFLPSFIFILAGGPMVEASRDDLRMTAPLSAISAAVVGVICSLALFFGVHVFAGPDWKAIAIALAACLALFRYQVGTIKLIAACALAGLVLSYWNG